MIAGDGAIVIEVDPLGLLVQPVADWDLEVSDFPIVELVSGGWLIEGLFIVEYPLLQVVDAIFIPFGGHAGTCLSISDHLK
jgi:hypothetical protein